ncbi:MAG: cytochrome c oxidase subunit, partial [Actinomycetota bacterium]|nr:cytochrome c oxidase subunit [Actinomycetota bacterium]
MMATVRRWRRLALLIPLVLFTACAKNAPQDIFQPKGTYARKIDNLQRPVFYIAGVVFVIVEGLIIFAIFRYRQRRGEDDETYDELPPQIHGNFKLEIGWTILP